MMYSMYLRDCIEDGIEQGIAEAVDKAVKETKYEDTIKDAVIAVTKFNIPPELAAKEYNIPLNDLLEHL